MADEPKVKGRKLRVQRVQELGVHWPRFARLLIKTLTSDCVEADRSFTSFAVPGMPLSVNHQYIHKPIFRKTKKGKAMMTTTKVLKSEVHEFRELVRSALEKAPLAWSSSGVTAAVVILESPVWLTKEFRARKADADNKLKGLFDAIERATGVPDELHWEIHVFKAASHRERTITYLFDLGDIVELFTKDAP